MKNKTILGLSLVFLTGLQLSGCTHPKNNNDKILIPNGYIGWVRIDYSAKDARHLQKIDRNYVYFIPNNGYLKTSSIYKKGVDPEDFEYIQVNRRVNIDVDTYIWNDSIGGAADKKQFTPMERTFFVGTQSQFNLASQFNVPVGRINSIAFQIWGNGQDLSYKDLSKRNFSKANLKGANLLSSSLKNANLQGADLSYSSLGSNLTGANLQWANIYAADLREAVMIGANLQHCDLRKARVQGVDLSTVKLSGANVVGTEYDSRTKWPRSFDGWKHGAIVKVITSVP